MTEPKRSYMAWIPANVRYDEDLTANAKLLYGEITALCNEKGYCWATNAYFADLYKVTKTSISLWIKQLIDKGYISSEIIYKEGTKEILNRYLKIINDPIQENLSTPTQKNLKENNTINLNNTINNTLDIKDIAQKAKKSKKNSNSSDLESEFELLWKKYPRKIGRAKALQSFIKARKTKKYTFETIEFGLNKYLEYIENQGTEEQYIAHFTTWLNQERFMDDFVCTAKKKPKNVFEFMQNEYGGNNYERAGNGNIIDYDTTGIPRFF